MTTWLSWYQTIKAYYMELAVSTTGTLKTSKAPVKSSPSTYQHWQPNQINQETEHKHVQNKTTQKVALVNSTKHTHTHTQETETKRGDRQSLAWLPFMTSGQETNRVYSFNPQPTWGPGAGACIGLPSLAAHTLTHLVNLDHQATHTPTPHRPDAHPVIQPTVSNHWRHMKTTHSDIKNV